MQYDTTTSKWINIPSTTLGEANTASNAGTGGIGITLAKSGVNLPFKSMYPLSSKITIGDGGANNRVEFDINLSGIRLDEMGTPQDNTTLNATSTYHGLLPKLPNDAGKYLNGLGSWATVTGGSADDAGIVRVNGTAINSVARKLNFSSDFTGTDDDTNGEVDIDIVNASTTAKGLVELAADAESAAGLAVQSNDSRLTNARAPTAHASSHKAAGGDIIKLDELGAPTDITTLNASTGQHGLLPKLGGGTSNFLRADGTWAPPTALVSGVSILDKEVVELNVVNTTTETAIFSHTITGGTMNSTSVLRLSLSGSYLNNSGLATEITIKVKLATTIMWGEITGTGWISAGSVRRPWHMIFYIASANSTSSQKLGGHFSMGYRGTTLYGLGDLFDEFDVLDTPVRGTAALNMASDQTLSVTVQHADANANISFIRDIGVLELL